MPEGQLAIKVSKCLERLARKWKMSSTDELLRAYAHKDDLVSFNPKNVLFKLKKMASKTTSIREVRGSLARIFICHRNDSFGNKVRSRYWCLNKSF